MPFVIKDGKEIFVSEKRAQELVSSGEAKLGPDETIRTIEGLGAQSQEQASALQGATTPVSGEQLGQEIAEASLQEEFGDGVGNELQGFLEGTASGLTFGLSDAILAGTVNPKGLRERRRRTSFGFVGELTGAIGPALLSGGTGFLGSAARLTPTGALAARGTKLAQQIGGFKGAAVAGAVEGTLFGAGQGISNLALSNKPLTAESFVSEVGLNAIYGAAFGTGGAILGEGLIRAASKIGAGKRFPANPAFDLTTDAGQQFSTAMGGATGRLEVASRQALQHIDNIDAGRFLNMRTAGQTMGALDDATSRLAAMTEMSGLRQVAPKGGVLTRPRVKGRFGKKPAPRINPDAEFNTALGNVINAKRGLQQIFGEELDLARGLGMSAKELDDAARAMKNYADKVDELGNSLGLAKNHPVREAIRTAKKNGIIETRAGLGTASTRKAVNASKAAKEAFKKSFGLGDDMQITGQILDDLAKKPIDDIADAINKFDDYGTSLGTLGEKLKSPELVQELIDSVTNIRGTMQAGVAGLDDVTRGQLDEILSLFGMTDDALKGVHTPAEDMMKLLLAYKSTHLKTTKDLAKAVESTQEGASGFARKTGSFAAGRAIQQAVPLSGQGVTGAVAKSVMFSGGFKVGGMLVDALSGGLSGLSAVTGGVANKVRTGLKGFLKGSGKAAKKAGVILPKTILRDFNPMGTKVKSSQLPEMYKHRMSEVSSIVANIDRTEKMLHQALKPVIAVNAEVGDKVIMQSIHAMEYLHATAPKDPGLLMRMGKSIWRATNEEIMQWTRRVAVVQDPMSAVNAAVAGRLTPEAAETLRAVYPQIFNEMRGWLMENLAELQDNSTYAARINMGILFDVPTDPQLTQIVESQTEFLLAASQQEQQQQSAPQGGSAPDFTDAQQLQNRGV